MRIPGRKRTIRFKPFKAVDPTRLATPKNLTAEVDGAELKIKWDAVPNAQRYAINVPEVPSYDETTEGTHFSFSGEKVPDEYTVTVIAKADGYVDSDPATFKKVAECDPDTDPLCYYRAGGYYIANDDDAEPEPQWEDRKVYGWNPPDFGKVQGTDLYKSVTMQLLVPPSWKSENNDSVLLPDGSFYHCVGIPEDMTAGPLPRGFKPGKIVNLRGMV